MDMRPTLLLLLRYDGNHNLEPYAVAGSYHLLAKFSLSSKRLEWFSQSVRLL